MLRALSFSLICALPLVLSSCGGSHEGESRAEGTHTAATQTVEVGCAKCSYSMDGVTTCENAVKIDGKAMLVTGDHGFDVMAEGICRDGAKQAEVTGSVEGDQFVASSIRLTN